LEEELDLFIIVSTMSRNAYGTTSSVSAHGYEVDSGGIVDPASVDPERERGRGSMTGPRQ